MKNKEAIAKLAIAGIHVSEDGGIAKSLVPEAIKVLAAKKKMTKKQKEKLEEIYQKSIDDLSSYWSKARKKNDPDIVVDQIWDLYAEELTTLFGVDIDDTYDMFDFGPRDWFFEAVDGGIN